MKQPVIVASILWLCLSVPVWAHGVKLNAQSVQAISIEARFESGEPMAQAMVTIYAPHDPATPWLKTTTDDQGRVLFQPDPAYPGDWEITVRQAGHGDVIVIPISESEPGSVTAKSGSQPEWLQRTVITASVLWGCLGTTLYFAKRKP